MEQKTNYIALLILIILGVALGNLASSLITSKFLNKEISKEEVDKPKISTIEKTDPIKPLVSTTPAPPQETIKLSPEKAQETSPPKNKMAHKELIEKRKLDENGLRLAKKCSEWTIVHKDMNTQSSERGKTKHCDAYYDYLSFGNLPNAN